MGRECSAGQLLLLAEEKAEAVSRHKPDELAFTHVPLAAGCRRLGVVSHSHAVAVTGEPFPGFCLKSVGFYLLGVVILPGRGAASMCLALVETIKSFSKLGSLGLRGCQA